MGQKTNLVKSLHTFAKGISKEYPLQNMYLFGSRAKGTPSSHSDVDLLLVSSKFQGMRRLRRSPPLYLEWNLQYPVDFICLTPQEFRKKKSEIGIVREAVNNGVKII